MERSKDQKDVEDAARKGSGDGSGEAEAEVVPRGQVAYYAILDGRDVLSEHKTLDEAIERLDSEGPQCGTIFECRPIYPSAGRALEDKLQRDASVIISMLVWEDAEFVTGTSIARRTSKGRAEAIALLEREGLIVRSATAPKGGRGRPGYVVSLKKGTKLAALRDINMQLVK